MTVSQSGLTDADIEKAKQIAAEIAAHFDFRQNAWPGAEDEREQAHTLYNESIFSSYSYRGVGPMYISLHLPDDRSHLDVAINDLSTTSTRELARMVQADFKRMFEEAFPDYDVEIK
ncbi:MAG: hypothetical protein ACE5IL_12440 [Myxococcota bacterium]